MEHLDASATRGAALFLFPTDVMGGAENVLRMTARAALDTGRFERIILFVLAGRPSGTLAELEQAGATTIHSAASSEKRGLPALARVLRAERYGLVVSSHTHLNAAASAARRSGWLQTDRLVTRESTMAFERDYGRIGPVIRGLYRLYGGQDRVVCQTERMAQSLRHHTAARFADRTRHVPNPVDLSRFGSSSVAAADDRIVWCGRLAPVKSPERAIDALALLHAQGCAANLTMIGDGPLRPDLLDRAAANSVADAVVLTGRLANPAETMAASTVGLVTSDVEGFPNVVLEMLASGVRRVVSTNCAGGLADIPGVTVVDEHTPDALAAALLEALASPRPSNVDDYLSARSPAAFLEAIAA